MKIVYVILSILIAVSVKSQSYEIFVSDAGNFSNPPWQILKFDSSGQNPSVFITAPLSWPQDILFLGDSVVLISNLNSGKISRHDPTTGTYLSDFATSLGGPTRIKLGPGGVLYVLQWSGDGLVKMYNLDGSFIANFTGVPVPQAIGLDWDQNNYLYVSSYSGKSVSKFNELGDFVQLFIDSNLLGPTNIWFNNQNELLVNDYNGTSVKKFNSSGTYIGDFIQGISQAEGVCILPGGNIAIGSGATHSVRLYDSLGNYLQDLVAPGAGNLITPNAIAIRPISTTNIDEKNAGKKIFIYPSHGSEFHFSSGINNVKQIILLTTEGRFVQNIPIRERWKPENINEGYYLIKFILKNSQLVTEKIFISN